MPEQILKGQSLVLAILAFCLTTNQCSSQVMIGGGGGAASINWVPVYVNAPGTGGMVPTPPPSGVTATGWNPAPLFTCMNAVGGWEPEPGCGGQSGSGGSGGSTGGGCGKVCNKSAGPGRRGVGLPSLRRSMETRVPANSSILTEDRSIIDSFRFQYLHWADDFASGEAGGVNLRRFIRTRQIYHESSLGPDAFLNVDIKLTFSDDAIRSPSEITPAYLGASVYLFDPELLDDVRCGTG